MSGDRSRWGCDINGLPTDPSHPWHPDYSGPPIEGICVRPERVLAFLQRLFEEQEDARALAATEAALLCEQYSCPWPDWLRHAMIAMALRFVAGGALKRGQPGRPPGGSDVPANRYRRQLVHFTRWDAVAEALERGDVGDTLDECCEAASELLRGSYAQGSAAAIKDSYHKCQREGYPAYLHRIIRQLRLERRCQED